VDQNNFIRLLFSEQLASEEMVFTSLKLINRMVSKLRCTDFLSNTALQIVRRFFTTSDEPFQIEIISFCSQLARYKEEYSTQILDSGLVEICPPLLAEGSELLKEKTLHLIGNLSKHSNKAFARFKKHKII
jgi:hypothetical protein